MWRCHDGGYPTDDQNEKQFYSRLENVVNVTKYIPTGKNWIVDDEARDQGDDDEEEMTMYKSVTMFAQDTKHDKLIRSCAMALLHYFVVNKLLVVLLLLVWLIYCGTSNVWFWLT